MVHKYYFGGDLWQFITAAFDVALDPSHTSQLQTGLLLLLQS